MGGDVSGLGLDPTRRGLLVLHELTTLVAPSGARARLRQERRSHLAESVLAGTPRIADVVAAARGTVDDVRIAASCRRSAGEPRLLVAAFTDSTVSLAACGILLALMLPGVFLHGWVFTVVVHRVTLAAASVVLFGGYLVRFVARVRGRTRAR